MDRASKLVWSWATVTRGVCSLCGAQVFPPRAGPASAPCGPCLSSSGQSPLHVLTRLSETLLLLVIRCRTCSGQGVSAPVLASVFGRRGRTASLGIASILAHLLGQAKSASSLRQGRAFLSGRRNFPVSEGFCFFFFSSSWVPVPPAGGGEASTPGWASLPPC